MSSKTPNINLHKADKVADADQTFNIDTMLNENWDKLDTAIGEMRTEIGEIEPEIPDASTTQKGIVQLDDTTSSTSKGKAATADAVRRAKDEAIWAAVGVKDTRNVNAAPSTYVQGLTREFKVGAAIGLDGQTHVLLETYKPWMDVSGGVVHQIGFGGTTGTLYRRTGKEDATGWNGWVEQIHSGYPWQKHKMSEQNGASIAINGQDLNNVVATGFYDGQSLGNAPINSASEWWYIQVQRHSNSDQYVIQIARTLSSNAGVVNSYYQRIRINGTWHPWTEDLFQSVANGKASLKTAISGKGGTVSQAGSTPTFNELAAGVNNIRTGGSGVVSNTLAEEKSSTQVANGSWVRNNLFFIPPCNTAIIIPQSSDYLTSAGQNMYETAPIRTSMRIYTSASSSNNIAGGATGYYLLVDSVGNQMVLHSATPGTSGGFYGFIISVFIDFAARSCIVQHATEQYGTFQDSTRTTTINFPAAFAVNGQGVNLQAAINYSYNSSYYYSWVTNISSLGRVVYS